MVLAVFVRRLRQGKTYAAFREAWKADQGFGMPTRVVTGQGLQDDREIITIGFVDIAPMTCGRASSRSAIRSGSATTASGRSSSRR